MLPRVLLMAGWILPLVVLLLFFIKGQFYNSAVFTPPASEMSALPVPVSLGAWVLEDGVVLPADRMYEKINGKSDYYLQYGANALCSGEWTMGGQRWDMYLYGFETEQGARGAFNGERPSDGAPIEGIEGYTVPGQAALAVGKYYLQLNALEANADSGPAVELATALVPFLGDGAGDAETGKQVDLATLAGTDMVGEAEGFVPGSAFGFSSLNNVRTVDVSMNGAGAIWFTTPGGADLVEALTNELAAYGGEELFSEDGASGGSMFGSWMIAGLLNGEVWGVQNATSRESLMHHWNVLKERLKTDE